MRRVSDGRTSRRLRTTVPAHHVVFPSFFPPSSCVCLSSTLWLRSAPRVSFFFLSLCFPSVVVPHGSISPLLSALSCTFTRPRLVCFNSCLGIWRSAALVSPLSSRWLQLSRSAAFLLSTSPVLQKDFQVSAG